MSTPLQHYSTATLLYLKLHQRSYKSLPSPDLILPEVILPLHGVLEGLVSLLQLLVVIPERVDLVLPVGVGADQALEGVRQLLVEGVARVERCLQVGLHLD